jgi:hypothetical protein
VTQGTKSFGVVPLQFAPNFFESPHGAFVVKLFSAPSADQCLNGNDGSVISAAQQLFHYLRHEFRPAGRTRIAMRHSGFLRILPSIQRAGSGRYTVTNTAQPFEELYAQTL